MDSDYRDSTTFDHLTHSPPAPPVPPRRKRQVREDHRPSSSDGAQTPTIDEYEDAYGMPSHRSSKDTLQSLHVDRIASPEYFTTDLSPSVHTHAAERPTDFSSDFPPNVLYPDSTNIDLTESEIQYVHPRYSDAYLGSSGDERTLAEGESQGEFSRSGFELSPSPPLLPPPDYMSSDPLESSDNLIGSSEDSLSNSDQRDPHLSFPQGFLLIGNPSLRERPGT